MFCRFAKDSTLGSVNFSKGDSFFRRGNLDLVVIPDIVIAVAEKLATQVGELNRSSSSGN